MITILHGDNQVASRERFNQLREEAKSSEKEVITIDGKGIVLTDLIQNLESHSLFTIPKTVFIENLIASLRMGTKSRETVIEYLIAGRFDADAVLWESKSVGKSLLKLKKQKHVQIEDFKLPVVIFKFTESLTPATISDALYYYHEAVKTSPAEVVFAMIVRQFRIMLALATGAQIEETTKMSSWVKGNAFRQSAQFDKEKLTKLYKQLLILDYQAKSGRTPFDLTKSTEQFIMSFAIV